MCNVESVTKMISEINEIHTKAKEAIEANDFLLADSNLESSTLFLKKAYQILEDLAPQPAVATN